MKAAAISLGKISSEFLFSKADDYLLKNSKIDEVLSVKFNIKRKVDSTKKKKYNGIKLDEEEYARLSSAVGTYKPQKQGLISQILNNKKGDPAYIYDVFIDDDGKMTVLGRHFAQNIHEKENIEDAYRKRNKSYSRNR